MKKLYYSEYLYHWQFLKRLKRSIFFNKKVSKLTKGVLKMILKRTLKTCVTGIVVLGLFLTGLNYLGIFLDEEPIEYSGLLPLIEVDPKDNGFDVLEQGLTNIEKFNEEVEDVFHSNWDEVKVTLLLEKNKDKIQLVEEVLVKPSFKSHPIHFNEGFPDYLSRTNLVKLLLIQSEFFAKQSRFTESMQSIDLALKFNQRIKTDQSAILVGYFVGIRMEYLALNKLHEIISNYSLTNENLDLAAALFNSVLDYSEDNFEMIFSGEAAYNNTYPEDVLNPSFFQRIEQQFNSYHFSLFPPLIEILSVPSHYYFFQYNRTQNRTYLEYVNLQSQVKSKFCNEIVYADTATKIHFLERFGMNAKGNFSSIYTMQGFIERRCFANFYAQAIKTVVAIKRYAQLNNSRPASLDELVPDFLNAIPLDPFTGEQILYNFEAQTISSAGLDSIINENNRHNYVRTCDRDEACASEPTVAIQFEFQDSK